MSSEATKVLGMRLALATASNGGMEPPGSVVSIYHGATRRPEGSQSLRDRLFEQHDDLLYAKHGAATANKATHSVDCAMCSAMERKMHSVARLRHAAAKHRSTS
jgi:poly(3-hydroxybutyrate) depolymerase